jgi:hypothetical protein
MGFNLHKDWRSTVPPVSLDYYSDILPVVRGSDINTDGTYKTHIEINYLWLMEKNFITRNCDYRLHSSDRPRILIADITSGIKAAFTKRPVLPMNSVKVILHKNDDEVALKRLLDYLRTDDAVLRLKEGEPNIHLTQRTLNRLVIPEEYQ